jgi:hypothetical protein
VEGSSQAAEGPVGREAGSERVTQVGLLIASLGAVLVLLSFAGLGVVGLFLGAGGAMLAAPGGLGRKWYFAVAGGAIVMVLSRLIAESSEVLGGWLAVLGAVAILIGASVGFPIRGERD